jgi:hypothetical protein
MDDDTRTGANDESRQSRLDALSERIRQALEGEDANDAMGMLTAMAVCIIATKFDTAAAREAAFADLTRSMRAWLARYPSSEAPARTMTSSGI